MDAIKFGDCSALEHVIDANPGSEKIVTAFGSWLHVAAMKGQVGIARLLLEKYGLDINSVDSIGTTSAYQPITSAAQRGHADMVAFLLDRGAVMDTSTSLRNPLFAAILGQNIKVAQILLAHGIDPNVCYHSDTMTNMTALEFAKEMGAAEFVTLLEPLSHKD